MFSLEGCDGYILPVSFTLWVCFVKQSEHPRVLYVEDKVIFPHLRSIKQLSNSLLDASLYPGDAFTSPFSSEIARTSRRWSSVSSIPYLDRVSTYLLRNIHLCIYSSQMTMYSSRDIVPSPLVSALSNSSHRATDK